MESKNSQPWCSESPLSQEHSKSLGESLEEVNQSVKQMLKLIQDDGDSLAMKAECQEKKPELIAHVEEFYRMYQTLVECFNHSAKEPCKDIPSGFQIQGSTTSRSDSNPVSPFFTPNQKLSAHKSGDQQGGVDMHFSSGGGSSDFSLKDGSESSLSLSSDSESEAFYSVNKFSSPFVSSDEKGFQQKKIIDLETEVPFRKEKLQVTEEENVGCILKEDKSADYEEWLGRISKYEEEQRHLKQKLQFSEEEVATLKCELKKKESLTGNLQARLEAALGDIVKKNADIDSEKRQALQKQNQIIELETLVSSSNNKIQLLEEELKFYIGTTKGSEEEIMKLKDELTRKVSEGSHQLQAQLELAWKDIAKLEAELDSERRHVAELQKKTVIYIADLSLRDHELKELKAQLQVELSSFSEEKIMLEERLKTCEFQSKSLQDEVRQCEAEIMNTKSLHKAREIDYQSEIHLLKQEHAERGDFLEVLNKNFDKLKLKYDMVMSEKDELNAKVQTLMAEKSSQNNVIRHAEEHLNRLQIECMELIARFTTAQKLVDELQLRVEELETELGRQRVLISEGAEKKREAIRQLCFSLEHYRSGYHELRQAFIGHRRNAVMAS